MKLTLMLMMFLIIPPTFAKQNAQPFQLDFRFQQLQSKAGHLQDPSWGSEVISPQTQAMFKKLLTENRCARKVAAGSALLAHTSARLAGLVTELIYNQDIRELLDQPIESFILRNWMVLGSHQVDLNGLWIDIHYLDGEKTSHVLKDAHNRRDMVGFNCDVFTEIELSNGILDALMEDMMASHPNNQSSVHQQLKTIAQNVYDHHLDWIFFTDMNPALLVDYKDQCKVFFNGTPTPNHAQWQSCIETKALNHYFALPSRKDDQTQTISEWVDQTIQIYDRFKPNAR